MSSLLLSLCAGLLMVSVGHASSVDLTLTDKATGSDVVEAVVDLIQQSCIFADDRLLLRRIAYVETQDGVAANTFKHGEDDFYGGIWQISSAEFTATKTSATKTVYGQITTVFGIDWSTVQYTDLVKPFYSGLAARLKIDADYSNDAIPQSVTVQATYWASRYTINTWGNTTYTTSLFVTASASVTVSCSSPTADIVFVLDGSGSIGAANFANVRTFVNQVVESFDVSQQKVRIGLIEFSQTAAVQFNLTTFDTAAQVENAVTNTPYFTGDTNSAAGILAMETMFQQQLGRQNDGVPAISIFMTDGLSNLPKDTAAAANQMHLEMPQVTVFAVGVGSGVNTNELDVIASKPSCLHVFLLSSFDEVTAFTDQIMDQACKVPAQLLPSGEVSGTVVYNQYYYFKITVHKQQKGVKIQIKTSSGGVKTYFSWKVHNPSPALYDFTGDADDSMSDGTAVHIPWNDTLSYGDGTGYNYDNSQGSRRRRSIPDNATGIVYGAVVGSQQKDNSFTLSYTDSASALAVSFLAGLMTSLVAVFLNY